MGESGGGQTLGGYGLSGPGVSFSEEKLKEHGKLYETHAGTIEDIADRTRGIGVPFPGFGVLGFGLHAAHDRARQSAADALSAGRDVLESWRTALESASQTYGGAEDHSTLPELPGGMPETGLPGGSVPGLDTPGLPGTDLPGGGVPGAGLPGTGALPGDGGFDGQVPGLPGQTATTLPGQGLGSIDPRRTDLSAYTPGDPSVPQFRAPDATTWTGDQAGTGTVGRGGGALPAGAGNGGLGGLPGGARGAAANGMPMMPMMPMGGAGTGEQERERDQTTWLAEDEGVWGGDEDVAPSVIGQEP
ncbi:hypothetical protein [Planomonospora algeriensis]